MRILTAVIIVLFGASLVQAAEGLVAIKSPHSVKVTADRFEAVLNTKGIQIFNRIDHAAAATTVGTKLRPTTLVIFGNPKTGTPLMQCSQTLGIDLPQKALIWQDSTDQTWFGYNDLHYFVNRHQLKGCQAVIDKVTDVLSNLARATTKP